MRDPMFLNKYERIISYWRHAAEDPSKIQDPALGWLTTGLANETAITRSAATLMTGPTSARPGASKPGAGPYLMFLRWIGWLVAAGLAALGAVLHIAVRQESRRAA